MTGEKEPVNLPVKFPIIGLLLRGRYCGGTFHQNNAAQLIEVIVPLLNIWKVCFLVISTLPTAEVSSM
jgi:hypothetical protein